MKNILSHLTGIVFLITILVTGGCGSQTSEDDPNVSGEELKKVVIEVRIYEVDGKKYLKLFESDKPESIEIDSLHVADVMPGTKVVWKRANDSGIRKFKRIGPVKPGKILPEDASTMLLNKRYRATVPNIEIEPGTKEEYIIVFVSKDGETIERDPY